MWNDQGWGKSIIFVGTLEFSVILCPHRRRQAEALKARRIRVKKNQKKKQSASSNCNAACRPAIGTNAPRQLRVCPLRRHLGHCSSGLLLPSTLGRRRGHIVLKQDGEP